MKKILSLIAAFALAAFTFTSCEDVPAPYDNPEHGGNKTEGEAKGDGTLANPFNVAGILEEAGKLEKGASSTQQYYFTGIITSIKECSAQFGNATFYIGDNASATKTFYVYRCNGLDNQRITDDNLLQVGDSVVICGTITNYNGTLETEQKGAYIVSINGKGGPGGGGESSGGKTLGKGTKDDPYNVAAADSICATLKKSSTSASYLSNEVYVKGKISSIVDTEFNSQYQNITYYISDDGKDTGTQIEVYRGFGLGGAKFNALDDIKVGDDVIVCGKLQNWLGTYEFTQGSSLYSLNGKVAEGGTGDDTGGTTGGGSSEGLSIDGTTVTLANPAFTAGTTAAIIDLNTQGWENATAVTSATFTDGATVAFSAGTNTTYPPKFYTGTKGIRCYSGNTLTFTGKSNIAKVVMDCDEYNGTKYVGSAVATVAFNGSSVVYTNVNDGKNTQLRVKTITIYYAQ